MRVVVVLAGTEGDPAAVVEAGGEAAGVALSRVARVAVLNSGAAFVVEVAPADSTGQRAKEPEPPALMPIRGCSRQSERSR